MADERPDGGHSDAKGDEEARLRGTGRVVFARVLVGLVGFLVLADVLGRLLVNPNFHVDPVMFASLLGTLVALLGIEGAAKLPWSGPK